MQKMVSKWIPEEKVSQMDNEMDSQVILRRLGSQKRKSIAHRENRSHLIADEVQYIPSAEVIFLPPMKNDFSFEFNIRLDTGH
jgi:hypothetical protein